MKTTVEHPHVFAMRLVSKHFGLCQKVRGAAICERITIPTAMMDEIASRDALIRAESAGLLKTCGEALGAAKSWNDAAQETLNPDRDIPCDDQAWVQIERANEKIKVALAALKDAGVLE